MALSGETGLNLTAHDEVRHESTPHWIGLDHIRALAAFLVFSWHFMHGQNGEPIPFQGVHFLAVIDEGHTGVALFMTLSGYLFAKLLDGKHILYPQFFWTRFLRLAPLLFVVIVLEGGRLWFNDGAVGSYLVEVIKGVAWPSLPNGAWSITVEAHFYIILPFLIIIAAKRPMLLLAIILAAITIRLAIYLLHYDVQKFAYGTIVGRIDQFIIGILSYKYRHVFKDNYIILILVVTIFSAFYYIFDRQGGAVSGVKIYWIILPTIEAMAYGAIIAWYDNSIVHSFGIVSRFIGKIGEYSYSIYLIHFFFVFQMAKFIDTYIMSMDNFLVALMWSAISFIVMMPIGYLSMRFIEEPPRRFRKKYVGDNKSSEEEPVLPMQLHRE